MLELSNVTVSYGKVIAVDAVSLSVRPGAVVALIGANGAGKSSILKAVCGSARITSGDIQLDGVTLPVRRRPHRVARLGIAHVPEGRRIIAPLTVEENLLLAAESVGADPRGRSGVYEIFPRLEERRAQVGGSLSGGEQQMLAIGRALIARPRLILMDEPSMGLAPIVVHEIYRLFAEDHDLTDGVTFLLAEQSAALALDVADDVVLLANGRQVSSGSADEMRGQMDAVEHTYLGGTADTTANVPKVKQQRGEATKCTSDP